jgi:polyisoprenoid-binding protein YceI
MKQLICLFLFTALGSAAWGQTLKIDTEKAVVKFNFLKHEVTGTVKGITGAVLFDVSDLTKSTIEGTAEVKTISTGTKQRDEHLMESEYFNAAKYPLMKFKSTTIEAVEDGYKMSGVLTIKDVEKTIDFKFTFNTNIFEGKATIYSNDFGIATEKVRDDSKIVIKVYIPVI